MTKTENVQTMYGDVEIEVVDCDSCGTTVAKEDAKPFTMADREGHACNHCVENGPIEFPSPDKVLGYVGMGKDTQGESFFFMLGLGWLLIPMLMVSHLFSTNDKITEFAQGMAFAMWTLVVYAGVAATLLWLLP